MKTPQQSYPPLNLALGGIEVFLKREDLHPYHSHKGRSIPLMIKEYRKKEGITRFAISSSGNAALAAAKTVAKHNQNNLGAPITLEIFVGKKVDHKKLRLIESYTEDPNISIAQVDRPKQEAFQLDTSGKAKNLRQSTDPTALVGYYELAKEIAKIPHIEAVFIPTSSGTTAEGLAIGFEQLQKDIQIHIVQTSQCHPIAEVFDTDFIPTEHAIAGAIVDQIAHRKDAVVAAITASGGSGWVVSDDDITNAMARIKETTHIDLSPNSALALAGLQKALHAEWEWQGPVACIITGQ
ncbi:MAG: hypothetical protein COU33_00240 [Candidatus Magasanikbacteria bacterium CG10_big_fil_rev_8_21_14_0_10_43_6]|uniref:Tryptophan synthase beta chain-like PALP domain-containing protein n=1 Tax=Candidatus Magasanikbacteria bacterium CG10_big_fil_rev_8_21_14_0_10_43_6 TaxID=1974650 RepID=A0A2M6W2F0_9BACT|nr:MAG: hypothetical protein COU33_00240 [Candidatus Magasanikbacteria bacterium CG10_big_fil_rev_8_21_14_0_10_43_6]